MPSDPLIFLSAGEASGDQYGAELIDALRDKLPQARFTGLGGHGMERAGQHRIVRAEDVAFMGITEILRHVPRVFRSYRRLVKTLVRERPQVAVLIDFPDVNFRLAKHCKRLGIPVVWFVSPQLWAWKRKRLRWVQQRVSHMLTIFPFEESFYRARGVSATFVGHPLAEAPLPTITREQYAQSAAHPLTTSGTPALDPARTWIALLPGSRRSEIAANFPMLARAASLLGDGYQYLVPLAPGATSDQVQQMERTLSATSESARRSIVLVQDARAALLHSRAAAIASGTATVQAAVLGTPFVTVYRVSRLTFRAAKRLVAYPAEVTAHADRFGNLPVAMPNLIAGRRLSQELLQEQFTAENVVSALRRLVDDGPDRQAALEGLRDVRAALLPPPGSPGSMRRLCQAVLDELASVH